MKKMFVWALVIPLLTLSLTGCFGNSDASGGNPHDGDAEDNPAERIFTDENETFSIKTDLAWEELEKGELNENADLEIADTQEGYYLMVMRENKSDFNVTFDEYSDFTAQMNGKAFGKDFGEKTPVSVNDLNAYEFELSETYDYLNAFIAFYTIEGQDAYYMLFAWGMDSDREELKKTLVPILDSFQEL